MNGPYADIGLLPSYFPGFGAKATIYLMQESNQRKSRKNNASTRKIATRTPLFFRASPHGIFVF
jgi:hypothetical protein